MENFRPFGKSRHRRIGDRIAQGRLPAGAQE
jgi:hypothetical protein